MDRITSAGLEKQKKKVIYEVTERTCSFLTKTDLSVQLDQIHLPKPIPVIPSASAHCEKQLGLPCARHVRFQLAPTQPSVSPPHTRPTCAD